jgi:hypothetical protein
MPRKSATAAPARTDVDSMKRESEELRKVLFDLLDYMGGSDLVGLTPDHPLAKAWALRTKLLGE